MLEMLDVAHISNVFCCLVLLEVTEICDIGCEVGFTMWPADLKPCKIRELLIALQPLLMENSLASSKPPSSLVCWLSQLPLL